MIWNDIETLRVRVNQNRIVRDEIDAALLQLRDQMEEARELLYNAIPLDSREDPTSGVNPWQARTQAWLADYERGLRHINKGV